MDQFIILSSRAAEAIVMELLKQQQGTLAKRYDLSKSQAALVMVGLTVVSGVSIRFVERMLRRAVRRG
ncbi:MAG: hypothetical protein NVS4B9_38840 [Ktedonobacteraceae bacterium]